MGGETERVLFRDDVPNIDAQCDGSAPDLSRTDKDCMVISEDAYPTFLAVDILRPQISRWRSGNRDRLWLGHSNFDV